MVSGRSNLPVPAGAHRGIAGETPTRGMGLPVHGVAYVERWEYGGPGMARQRVLVYQDGRGWHYYWREGDVFTYMLRAQLSTDLAAECQQLDEHGIAPRGSVGTRWTPDLFAPDRVRLIAVYEKGRLHPA